MRYKDRDKLVEGLREFADFIEEKGLELPIQWPEYTFRQFISPDYTDQGNPIDGSTVTKLAKAAQILAPCKKRYNEFYFDIVRRFGPIRVEFTSSRNNVCTPRVVGQKHIPQQIIPARTEDVIEWECAPALLEAL